MTPDNWELLIKEFVLPIVITVVLAYVIWRGLRQNATRMDEMQGMLLDVRKSVPKPPIESVEKVSHLTMTIRRILKEAQLDFKPDYLHLWQFHNGTILIGKGRIPYMFMTMTQELCADGVEAVISQFVQLPLGMVNNVISVLINNPLLIERSNTDGTSDNPISQTMFSMGISTQELLSIKDENGDLVAMLEFCFKEVPVFDDARRNVMKDYAARVGIVLASYGREDQTG